MFGHLSVGNVVFADSSDFVCHFASSAYVYSQLFCVCLSVFLLLPGSFLSKESLTFGKSALWANIRKFFPEAKSQSGSPQAENAV